MPTGQAGVASGDLQRLARGGGLLGITVIGAMLTARQGEALRSGHSPVDAFLSGYQLGLLVAAVLVAAGGVAAYLGLRTARGSETAAVETVPEQEVPVLV